MWSIHSKKFKMATGDIVMLVVLNELVDSDGEKPRRGKTRDWIKRRKEKGYFNNIVKELKIEDRFGFREMFRMDIADLSSFLLRFSIEFHQKKDFLHRTRISLI